MNAHSLPMPGDAPYEWPFGNFRTARYLASVMYPLGNSDILKCWIGPNRPNILFIAMWHSKRRAELDLETCKWEVSDAHDTLFIKGRGLHELHCALETGYTPGEMFMEIAQDAIGVELPELHRSIIEIVIDACHEGLSARAALKEASEHLDYLDRFNQSKNWGTS